MGESQLQEFEEVGHMSSVTTESNDECMNGSDVTSTFSPTHTVRESPLGGWCHPQWKGLPTSINLTEIISHRHLQAPTSQDILCFSELIIDTTHHLGCNQLCISVTFLVAAKAD